MADYREGLRQRDCYIAYLRGQLKVLLRDHRGELNEQEKPLYSLLCTAKATEDTELLPEWLQDINGRPKDLDCSIYDLFL